MSANTDALINSAAAATANLKATQVGSKEAIEQAFIESALATFLAVKSSKNGASRLTEINKAAKVGYGSPAAVGYHAVTGQYLSLPEGEFDGDLPSAKSIQTLVKKVGQVDSKAIIGKAKSQAVAFTRLTEAVKPEEFDILKALEAARDLISEAEDSRLRGNALPSEADAVIASIRMALDNVALGDTPCESEETSPRSSPSTFAPPRRGAGWVRLPAAHAPQFTP